MQFFRRRAPLNLLMVAVPLLVAVTLLQRLQPAPTGVVAPTATTRAATPATRAVTATATIAPPVTPTRTPLSSRLAAHDPGYVPILMYHYVRVVDEAADPLGFRLSVTPERFAEQMAWLHDNDYTPMRMDALSACLRGQETCPTKPVALTFDDGYEDSASAALPILKRYGFVATFFIAVNLIDKPGYMSWEQLALLRDSGMEIGSHTLNHADLTGLTTDEAYHEIVRSREMLEQRLGAPVLSFSYPAGSYTLGLASLVRAAGYTSAVITFPGHDLEHLYELPRRRILGGETIEGFPWYMVPMDLEGSTG